MQCKCWASALSCVVPEIMVRKEILRPAQMAFLPEFLDLQWIESSAMERTGTEEQVHTTTAITRSTIRQGKLP